MYWYLFQEIKYRLFMLFLTGLSVFIVSYLYKEVLLFYIFSKSPFYSYIYTSVTGIFSVYTTVTLFVTNQVILFYFIFHILIFLGPGLYDYEYYYLKMILYINSIIFILSFLVFNGFIFPLSCNFFLSFQHVIFKSLNFYLETKIDDYLKFYVISYYACYFYFQIFVFLIFVFFYLKDSKDFKVYRKLFYFLFCIIYILMIPADILLQFFFVLVQFFFLKC